MRRAERDEAVDLQIRLADAIDRRDWARVERHFAVDATADLPRTGRHETAAAMTGAIKAVVERLLATQHHLSNHLVDEDGANISAQCYVIAQHVRELDRGPTLFTFGGRYTDRLVREAGTLRIAHRQLEILWRSGDPLVLA